MKANFHSDPFSQSTKVKLDLFKGYFSEWLPVFLHKKPQPSYINVVDFFSGPGEDVEHTPGSPLLILEQIRIFRSQSIAWPGRINIVFNDADQKKTEKLEILLEEKFKDVKEYVQVKVQCMEFADLFERLRPELSRAGSANLLFIDQSGVRELPAETFGRVISLNMTDLLFFVSSSTVGRFHDVESVHRYLPIPEEIVHSTDHYRVHKMVKAYYESLIPEGHTYFMGDFSLRKGSNIYGLIFGSNSLLGLKKFVDACWRVDDRTGEANYSIDREDFDNPTPLLFDLKPHKVDIFEQALKGLILDGRLATNRDVVEYTLRNGMLCSHAREVLRLLAKEGIIESAVPISYGSVQKTAKPIRIVPKEGRK